MAIAFLMIGMITGFVAGLSALLLGQTILMALAIYALSGITGAVLGALAALLPVADAEDTGMIEA